MRLLVLYQHAPTPGAPGIYRHRALLSELVRRGWAVDLISSPINYMDGKIPSAYARKRYVHEQIDGIDHHWVRATDDVHRSFRRRARNYVTFAYNATLRGFRLPKPDLVWASSPPLSVATAGRMVARKHRVPWVLEVRDLWPESAAAVGLLNEDSWAYRLLDRFARTYARTSAGVIVPTPGLVDLVRGHGAVNVSLVTGAIENNPPSASTRDRIRAELGIPQSACVFAYVGAHGVVNGLDLLLDAAEIAHRSSTTAIEIHTIMAGAGSASQTIDARLKHAPIPNVHKLGPLPKKQAREILHAADVGLHLLRPDPVFASALPTKVLEYLGCHLPFITTVPGLPEKVAKATGGDLATSAEELANAMQTWAARSVNDRHNIGEQAYVWGEDHYGLTSSVDTLEQFLSQAISN